ncbi:MAG: polyprenyl synthetase family protein [Jatrophihabitans sp.]
MTLSVVSGLMSSDGPGHERLVERIDAGLIAFLDERQASLADLGDDLVPVLQAVRSFVLDGGKRLRPRFVYWGWRSAGTHDPDAAVITAAASLELLHACALVHDDVMDASDTRRGNPAVHAAFASIHREAGWTGDADAFGTASAILIGDLLLSWSEAMFTSADLPPEHRPGARRVYDRMRELVMAGQYLDVLVQARGEFSVDEALRVITFKTSKYTVEGPLHLGAAAAGAPPEVFAALSAYGLAVGEAFQLRDDVLGVFGDPGVTGKPAGDDLREGKQTLLTALAMERATDAQAAALRAGLGNRELATEGVAALRNVIVATGALDQVEHRIAAKASEARVALDDDALDDDATRVLTDLIGTATHRHS